MRPLRLLSSLVVLCACSAGDDDGYPAPGPLDDGHRELADYDLPEDVRAYLIGIRDRLVEPLCERSRFCCDFYGLPPRRDCLAMAEDVVTYGPWAALEAGHVYEFALAPAFGEKCVATAIETQHQCVEGPFSVLANPCSQIVRSWDIESPGGARGDECSVDEQCVTLEGAGSVCGAGGACVPGSPVETGASCLRVEGATSAPICQPGFFCQGGPQDPEAVCAPRLAIGQPCSELEDLHDQCVDGAYCDLMLGCQPLKPEGAPCRVHEECQMNSCWDVCVRYRLVGESCTVDDDCLDQPCVDGMCTPYGRGYCAPRD